MILEVSAYGYLALLFLGRNREGRGITAVRGQDKMYCTVEVPKDLLPLTRTLFHTPQPSDCLPKIWIHQRMKLIRLELLQSICLRECPAGKSRDIPY